MELCLGGYKSETVFGKNINLQDSLLIFLKQTNKKNYFLMGNCSLTESVKYKNLKSDFPFAKIVFKSIYMTR